MNSSIRTWLGWGALIALAWLPGCQESTPAAPLWEGVALGTDAEFKDIFFENERVGWIVGGGYFVNGGILGRTDDGGRSWSYQSDILTQPKSNQHIYNAHSLGGTRLCAVGSGGRTLLSVDDGKNWRPLGRGPRVSDHLHDLDFVDERYGWAIGRHSLFRTTDGCESWSLILDANEKRPLPGLAIQFVDRQNGWLAGRYGVVRKSFDGGESWQLVEAPGLGEQQTLRDIFFLDRQRGWIVGDRGLVLRTEDAGQSWDHQRLAGVDLQSVQFLDAQVGWTLGFKRNRGISSIFRTEDGGASWILESEIEGEELEALFALDSSNVWAVGDRTHEGEQRIYIRRADR